jgi:hypothetical protein
MSEKCVRRCQLQNGQVFSAFLPPKPNTGVGRSLLRSRTRYAEGAKMALLPYGAFQTARNIVRFGSHGRLFQQAAPTAVELKLPAKCGEKGADAVFSPKSSLKSSYFSLGQRH